MTIHERLVPEDWEKPTACAGSGWDVRAVAGHCLGMAQMAASMRQTVHQMRAAKRRGGVMIDALTAVQVEERAQLSAEQVVSRFARVGPRAARGRRRAPGFVRHRTMPDGQLVGNRSEEWAFGYLVDVVLTRDPWMHRADIVDATQTTMTLTRGTPALVSEWPGRRPHRRPGPPLAVGPSPRPSGGGASPGRTPRRSPAVGRIQCLVVFYDGDSHSTAPARDLFDSSARSRGLPRPERLAPL